MSEPRSVTICTEVVLTDGAEVGDALEWFSNEVEGRDEEATGFEGDKVGDVEMCASWEEPDPPALTILAESTHLPAGNGQEEASIILAMTNDASAAHPFVTWMRIYPAHRKPHRSEGNYFPRNRLALAVSDYERRCDEQGVAPYPSTF